MVIDTSALFELAVNGPMSNAVREALDGNLSAGLHVSAATIVETHVSLRRRHGADEGQEAVALFEDLIVAFGVSVTPFDATQAHLAVQGFARFGKGTGGGALNFGDCFSYALAKHRNEPLLFVGDDFRRTDVRVAL